jgi:hypothetical protein
MRDLHRHETPSTDLFIRTVIDREGCGRHKAEKGEPCWVISRLRHPHAFFAVCNRRAKKAGYNHPISDNSLRTYRNKK